MHHRLHPFLGNNGAVTLPFRLINPGNFEFGGE